MPHGVRIGCSGWQYQSWRERFYPKGLPPRRWLAHYAEHFGTVEVNSTFYRLAKPHAVEGWVRETPEDFVFAVKASQYLTHMKRLRDIEQGVKRFYDAIEPLARSPKLGPVLWQLPERMKADVPVLELLRWHHVALVVGDHPERPWQPLELTTDWTFVRFHHGHRGRRGNYSETELSEWAARVRDWRERADVFAYFNNDWEAFAVHNARRLRELVLQDG
jgi:uncharacterized protein YecE (DUF72 family)